MFDRLLASKPAKASGRSGATAAAIAIHAVIIVGLIYVPVHAASTDATENAVLIPLPKDDPVLPPPKVDVPPPVQSQAPVPIGFQTLAMPEIVPPDIPPPQVGVQIKAEDYTNPRGVAGGLPDSSGTRASAGEVASQPFMTPMDVAPRLLNRDAIGAVISRNYPPLLRDAGIGGTTKVWFYIDEHGRSTKQLVKTPSGYATLDSAALRVAPEMRFTPAMTHDKPVAVWVALDIVFRIR